MSDTSADEENVFYFESDHLALRGNRDYCNVLRAIVMLQAQRLRVHKQIDELEESKRQYLADPELLLEKIRNNEPIVAPNYMSIVKIPELSGNYDLPQLPEKVKVKTEHADKSPVTSNTNVGNSEQHVVRGRVVEGIKSETFNRLWTNEEQRRLEQLLVEYPPEEVEARRFAKIAKALGNRTPQQVSSRVQKYFVKLHEAGMPVPGRLPKYRRTPGTKPKYYKQSTFFPAHNLTMQMPEEDDFMLDSLQSVDSPAQGLEEDFTRSIKTEIKQDDDSEQASCEDEALSTTTNTTKPLLLKLLKSIRDEKIKTAEGYNPDPLAAKCAECETATVARTRWRCNSCYCYLNLCLDCLAAQLLNKTFEHITHDVEEVA